MPNTADNDNKRRFSRITFEADVLLTKNGQEWRTKIHDISLNGLMVETPANWDPAKGEQFDAEIIFTDSGSLIHVEVAIVHEENGHIGFQINNIDIESVSHLRRLLELNLADTALLNRELMALHWR